MPLSDKVSAKTKTLFSEQPDTGLFIPCIRLSTYLNLPWTAKRSFASGGIPYLSPYQGPFLVLDIIRISNAIMFTSLNCDRLTSFKDIIYM